VGYEVGLREEAPVVNAHTGCMQHRKWLFFKCDNESSRKTDCPSVFDAMPEQVSAFVGASHHEGQS
jgi:hypothetical protein